MFRLASKNDVEHIQKRLEKRNSKGATTNGIATTDDNNANIVTTVNILEDGDIGIKFASSPDGFGLSVAKFLTDSDGRYTEIAPNYILSHINGKCVLGENGSGKERALELLESEGATRPISLGFVKPYLYDVVVEKDSLCGGPSELILSELKPTADSNAKENHIVLTGFSLADGAAETSGKVFIGDNLVFINGIPVGAGCRLADGKKANCPPLGKTCLSVIVW